MSRQKKRTTEDNLYIAGLCILLAAVLLFLWKHQMYPDVLISEIMRPCVVHALTGWYCPGCGGTRSVEALFHGRFLICAVNFPLTAYAVLMFDWFMLSQTIQRCSKGRWNIGLRWRNGYLWIALGILIAHFIAKNIFYLVTGIPPFLS